MNYCNVDISNNNKSMGIRGVRLTLQNESDALIADVLAPMDISKYYWLLDNIEIHSQSMEDNQWDFEMPVVINGEEFAEKIQKGPYYAIFGELFAFPTYTEPITIEYYETFLESNAELVLLIVDSIYYDIYCKNFDLIESLYKNAKQLGFEVEYIDKDDSRTKLKVF